MKITKIIIVAALLLAVQSVNLFSQSSTNNEVIEIANKNVTSISEVKDVKPTDDYYQSLMRLSEVYYIKTVYRDSTFRGNQPLTRLQLAVFLHSSFEVMLKVMSANNLKNVDLLYKRYPANNKITSMKMVKDIPSDFVAFTEIEKLYEKYGINLGDADGYFRPNKEVSENELNETFKGIFSAKNNSPVSPSKIVTRGKFVNDLLVVLEDKMVEFVEEIDKPESVESSDFDIDAPLKTDKTKETKPTDLKCLSGNCVNGKGKKTYDDGNIYEGEFVNGEIQGQGKIVYNNGDTYEGGFFKGTRQGQGTYTFKAGGFYIGQSVNSQSHGKGKFKYGNGDLYEGDFVDGNREGQGTYTAQNGNHYIGEWKNGKFNGNGKFYNKSTNITQEGTWENGEFVNSKTAPNVKEATALTPELLITKFKDEGVSRGATLIGSGIWEYNVTYNPSLNVEAGQTYVIVAATEYDPNTFGFYLRYNNGRPVVETHNWNDKAYQISPDAEYAMRVETSKVGNLSARRMNFSLTSKSSVNTIEIIFSGKSKVHWLCYRLK